MIKSMTGYSRQEAETELGRLTLELKTWNHRYCQVSVRLPPLLSRFEHQIQRLSKSRIDRGQVQITIEQIRSHSNSERVVLDLALAKQYHAGLAQLQNTLHLMDEVSLALLAELPGVFTVQEPSFEEDTAWYAIQGLLEKALDELEVTKCTEGLAMFKAIDQHLRAIQSLSQDISASAVDSVEAAQSKLEARLNELFGGQIEIDPNRIVMEAGMIAARSDITEELVRLDSHCVQFNQYLQSTTPVGRQLDFLLQEMNREANTIASKASLPAIASMCVSLKTAIEKIREIVQNVE